MAIRPVTVNDILDGHVVLDLECLDRLEAADPILDSWRADGMVLAGTATFDEVLVEAAAKERV